MSLREFFKELHHRNVFKVAVAYTAAAVVLLEVLTHLFHNFEAPQWVLKVITTLLIVGLPVACLMAWGFEFKESGVRSVPRVPKETQPALPAPKVTAPPSIAVLPFADMSAEHDQQYLGDGIAEELLNALASIEGLNVAARTSSFAFAGKGASMTEIGDTLHVRHVLEGSVRRAGQRLRITAQLIDVKNGFHLFTQSYDREVTDIFDIQNEIAREIASALLPKLGLSNEVMLVRQGTSNLEAYNLWLKAHQTLRSPDPITGSDAISQLRQALVIDPGFGEAWGDLAYSYTTRANWVGDPVPLLMKTNEAAAIALVHAPRNVPALLEKALITTLFDRDPAGALSYYERARAAGVERYLLAFNLAIFYYAPLGRYDEAIAELREAERQDPLAPNLKWELVEMYAASGRTDEALAAAQELERLEATVPGVLGQLSYAYLANAYISAGDTKHAGDFITALCATAGSNSPVAVMMQFYLAAATANLVETKRILERLVAEDSAGGAVSYYLVGEGCKAMGDYDRTIEWWTRAVDRYEIWALAIMPVRNRNHPIIGKDPRFLALLKRMGLESDAEEKGAAQ